MQEKLREVHVDKTEAPDFKPRKNFRDYWLTKKFGLHVIK